MRSHTQIRPVVRAAATVLGGALLLLPAGGVDAQDAAVDPGLYEGLEYRMIGPFRGGRSTAVTGHPTVPEIFFTGTTGGGVWVSDDAGQEWTNVSDPYFDVGSIGAMDVADSDPSVVYVGTGSACIRGNVSQGRGVYKSEDGGRTWSFSGLRDAGQIGDLKVHPTDPDVAYLAALGQAFGPGPDRGVYRTDDGGDSWEKVLFVSDSTGFVDLGMDPTNPRVLYAAAWQAERKPWVVRSGGSEGGIWKSTDGGDTWDKLGGGLPTGIVGKAAVAVSPADPNRVWALVEAPEPNGGLYRSDDAGRTWSQVNRDRRIQQRAYYYIHLEPDPRDRETVYAMNTRLYRSVDGGRSLELIEVPHGDVHDLWIDPDDPDRMIVANDGGGQVTVDHGETWTTYFNQPTAEFYSVTVDDAFPYRVYGPQQDNSTITVPSWWGDAESPEQFWYSVGGCETGPIAMDPDDPAVAYSGCYGGVIDRWNQRTGETRNVMVYPQLQLGTPARDLKYRFQWNSPIVVDPHDSNTIYHAAQVVLRTRDRGMSWEEISPDLTTDDPDHQKCGGSPITCEGTGVEVFNTIYALTVSPHERGVVWAGTDDGRLHLTRNDGGSWAEVTPPGMPELGTVNRVEVSPHDPATAYVAVHAYRMGDFSPYAFRTDDYGASWERLTDGTNGIPADFPVRVVRADPEREGLLYAGTEFGLFVSFDDGERWQSLQLDLPATPVTDLKVHRGDLVVATQGRSFWILDDLAPLRQMDGRVAEGGRHLFTPGPTHRVDRGGGGEGTWPENRQEGALITYWFADAPGVPVTLEILDGSGEVIRTFRGGAPAAEDTPAARLRAAAEMRDEQVDDEDDDERIPTDAGLNRFAWDLTTEGVDIVDDATSTAWGHTGGAQVVPGTYQARLTAGTWSETVPVEVLPDPRLEGEVTLADLREQYETAVAVRDTLGEIYDAIREIRSVRSQVTAAALGLADREGAAAQAVVAHADSMVSELTAIEEQLIQTQAESRQDPINFQPRLDHQTAYLYGYVAEPYGRPTEGAFVRFGDINAEWNELRAQLDAVIRRHLARFNAALVERAMTPVISEDREP